MKLRLLNGSHSTLAYLGYLSGYETIADTMADPAFVRLIEGLMDEEVTPTLHMPPGADLISYKRALIERFKNPALKHRTWQIAMDGSQKLPQRLLGTVRDRCARVHPSIGSPSELRLGCAMSRAWMRKARPSTCAIRWQQGCGSWLSPQGAPPSAWQRSCSLCVKFSGTIFPRTRASLAL